MEADRRIELYLALGLILGAGMCFAWALFSGAGGAM